jgi:hypothetical protein
VGASDTARLAWLKARADVKRRLPECDHTTPSAAPLSCGAETVGVWGAQRMLVYDPAKRIHAVQALEHPYFNSLDKSLYDKYDVTRDNKENASRVNV